MFIDFEGIDGSGKTTLSNIAAERLRRRGHRVMHAREAGELKAPIARRLRELTRDPSLLEMSRWTEFFLNVARDAQQLEEVIRPALARGEICITDRYLYSQLALSGGGRGLPFEELERATASAAQGIWPDLIILVDVDPDLARLRKRVAKWSAPASADGGSRKGLCGAGLAVRMRHSFLEMAQRDPTRWLVLENRDQSLSALAERVCEAISARLEGRALAHAPRCSSPKARPAA
ncbi:MAG TPA: dTMP kinase, partial [Myxococcaceae bacterium]|nr:dTMP kinase [Myxococcaceae bacterium]